MTQRKGHEGMIQVRFEPAEARALCRAVELLTLVFEDDGTREPRPLDVAAMKLETALVCERELL